MTISYLIPDTEVGPAGGKGRGIFTTVAIPAGTTVAAFGGRIMAGPDFRALPEYRRTHSIQVGEDLFLVAAEEDEPADLLNHSCEPNCGILGNVLVVTMRDVAAGEELTFDYAMCDSDDYDEFVCACDTPSCRRLVTGGDWRRPELQDRYRGWFSSYLERRIDAASGTRG